MGKFLDEIKDNIISEFGIRNINNLEILNQANTGFSGAEVYCIKLKNDSDRNGTFYLKIDQNSDEYDNSQQAKFARREVGYLEKKKINGYYVLLIDLAGKSIHEYSSFYNLESPAKRRDIIKLAFSELFEDAVDKKRLVNEEIGFTQLLQTYLHSKLEKGGKLYEYVAKALKNSDISMVTGIQFGDKILPNP